MHLFEASYGTAPLVVSMPHIGSFLAPELIGRLSATGRMVPDTDWDLDRLYDFLTELGTTVIRANYSRYVIDLNRDPDNRPLYPGMNMNHPGLVPTHSFDDVPLYRPGEEPDAAETALRRDRYWRPYHDRLSAILDDLVARHGQAVLFDCHSIRSLVPRYQAERIPDLNLGTADGTSCDLGLRDALGTALKGETRYSTAIDGIFKGGYITRHYGRPGDGIHAFQLELSWATYMQESPTPVYDLGKAALVKPVLREMVSAALDWVAG